MIKLSIKDLPPLGKILLLTCIMLGCSIIAIVLWGLFSDGSLVSLKWMQVVQSVFVFILPCIICCYLWTDQPWKWLKLTNRPHAWPIILTILLFVCGIPFINLLSYWNEQLRLPAFMADIEAWMQAAEANAGNLTEQFLQDSNYAGLLFNLFIMAISPALSEEIFFRGTLQPLLGEKHHPHIAIWSTAILFSAIHMQFYGFIPRMLLGAVLGYTVYWSKSLWLGIIGHAVNNGMAVISYFIANRLNYNAQFLDQLGTGTTLWLGIVSGICVGALLYALRRSLTISNASSRNSSGN